jgi:diaminopimelate epimerase
MTIVKAHALGNDFLLIAENGIPRDIDRAALARRVCERHRGIGADGAIFFEAGERSDAGAVASMTLLNADGSPSEISGNGVRCLAASIARERAMRPGESLGIKTDAGVKQLQLMAVDGARWTFRAAMGSPEQVQERTLDVNGTPVRAVTLRVGNPQCVVLGEVTQDRLHTIASTLAVHPAFPAGSNVELASVERPDRVRILIWERGVGPTEASGTGACAAAVAAIAYGGAQRTVDVTSPGGTQRVEWLDDGLYLTGWAEVIGLVEYLL